VGRHLVSADGDTVAGSRSSQVERRSVDCDEALRTPSSLEHDRPMSRTSVSTHEDEPKRPY
jgi:hypothetical protein